MHPPPACRPAARAGGLTDEGTPPGIAAPSVSPNASDTLRFGIRPRSAFEILGWQATLPKAGPWTPLWQLFPVLHGTKPANESWTSWCANRSSTCPGTVCPTTGCINGGVP